MPELRVLVLTVFADSEPVFQDSALAPGVYLVKDTSLQKLLEAISDKPHPLRSHPEGDAAVGFCANPALAALA